MKDNNENDEKENQKISFEQFINDKINNSKDLNTEIKKEDLLNEINEKVENGNDNTIIEKINSIFSNNETIKIKQLKEESIKPEKKISPDLEFLSENLPEDKNREKILKQTISNIETLINKEENPQIKKEEITLDISKLESIIKPINEFDDIKNVENNEEKKKERPKEINKPFYKANIEFNQPLLFKNYSFNKANYLFNNKNNKTLILPKNENYIFNHKNNDDYKEISNLFKINKNGNDNKFKNNQFKDDYFYSIYKNVASKNLIIRNLKNLNDKVNKASSKPVSINGIYGNIKNDNINLKNFTIKTSLNNPSNGISFLEKIEKEKNNIVNSRNYNLYYSESKKNDFDLKDLNERKFFDNLKDDFRNFNVDKDKKNINKKTGFDEINDKLNELFKKNKNENEIKNNEINENEIKEDEKIKTITEKTTTIETKKKNKNGQEEETKKTITEIKKE
jgi:hypothetical protein